MTNDSSEVLKEHIQKFSSVVWGLGPTQLTPPKKFWPFSTRPQLILQESVQLSILEEIKNFPGGMGSNHLFLPSIVIL